MNPLPLASSRPTIPRWRSWLDGVATVAMITASVIVAFFAWGTRPKAKTSGEAPLPTEPLSLDGAALSGDTRARVVLLEYSDFQCPYCGKFARETLPTIEEKYVKTGKVLVAFRNFPLSMHPFAHKAASSAVCAGRQGKFWAMHDELFKKGPFDDTTIATAAKNISLVESAFSECLSGDAGAQVERDIESGKALKVGGTPTIFLGTIQPDRRVKVNQRLKGAQPAPEVAAELDKLLKSAESNKGID